MTAFIHNLRATPGQGAQKDILENILWIVLMFSSPTPSATLPTRRYDSSIFISSTVPAGRKADFSKEEPQ